MERIDSRGRLVRILELGREERFERIQIDWFELTKSLHPDGGVMQSVRFQPAPLNSATPFLHDKTGSGQDRQMLADRGKRHPERLSNIGDGHVILEKHTQNLTSCRISQCRKNGVKRIGVFQWSDQVHVQ